jgi:hypothetical protein
LGILDHPVQLGGNYWYFYLILLYTISFSQNELCC